MIRWLGPASLAALTLVACGSSGSAPPPASASAVGSSAGASANPGSAAASAKPALENVTVSIPAQSLSQFPLTVGKTAGIYQLHGINLTIVQMKTDAAIASAISGEVAYSTPAGSLIRAIGQGAPLKMIATVMDKSNHLMLVNPKAVPTAKDLAGKKVAINSLGDNTQLEAEAVFTHFGVDKRSATFVVLPDDGPKVAGLQAGSVDAAIVTIPWNFKGEELGLRVQVNLADILALPTSVLTTNTQNITTRQQAVQAMVDATLESARYTRDHKPDVVKQIANFYEIPEKQADQAYDLSRDAWSATGMLSREAFANAATPLNLNPPLTLEKAWDPQFVQRSSVK